VKENALSAATEACCLILSIDETIKNPQSEQPKGGGKGKGKGGGKGFGSQMESKSSIGPCRRDLLGRSRSFYVSVFCLTWQTWRAEERAWACDSCKTSLSRVVMLNVINFIRSLS